MSEKFFNTVRQMQVLGQVVDPTGNISLEELDHIEKRDNLQHCSQANANEIKARKNDLYSKKQETSLEELAKEIAKRGHDMQTTHSKDGLKVFEVSKKLVRVIPN